MAKKIKKPKKINGKNLKGNKRAIKGAPKKKTAVKKKYKKSIIDRVSDLIG